MGESCHLEDENGLEGEFTNTNSSDDDYEEEEDEEEQILEGETNSKYYEQNQHSGTIVQSLSCNHLCQYIGIRLRLGFLKAAEHYFLSTGF